MKKRLVLSLMVVTVISLCACNKTGEVATNDELITSSTEQIEVVESEVVEVETEVESEVETEVVLREPVSDGYRQFLRQYMGVKTEVIDNMTQEEAMIKMREYAVGGGGAWDNAEDAQLKSIISIQYDSDGTIWTDLLYREENTLDEMADPLSTYMREKIEYIYINGVLIEEDWTTVTIKSGDIIEVVKYGYEGKITVMSETEANEIATEVSTETTNLNLNFTEEDRQWYKENFGLTDEQLNNITEEELNKLFDEWFDSLMNSNSNESGSSNNYGDTNDIGDNNGTSDYDPNAYYSTEYYIELYVPDELKDTLTVTSRDDINHIIYLEGGGRKYALSIPTSPDWDPNNPLNPPLFHDITDLPAGNM